ncbi:MAG: iron ABC transporter permease, partial [Pseudomonadota bacterium]
PYVYMLTRATFLEQSVSIMEVSRSLGNSAWRTFFRVNLPMSRPAIIAGVSLVMMESLADYGTVQYFGVSTFTTGIFRTWFGLDGVAAAAQLSALLLSFVFILLVLEQNSRRRARYYQVSNRYGALPRHKLKGAAHVGTCLLCIVILAAGFLIPAGQLLVWAFKTWEKTLNADFFLLVWYTLSLAGGAAIIALILAVFMNYGKRLYAKSRAIHASVRIAGLGYAAPGTIVAVGVIIPLAAFDNFLDSLMRAQFDISTGLLLSGTVTALLFAYSVRFLAVALQTVDAGLGKISPSMEESARALGHPPRQVLFKIHLPILRGSLLTAMLLVFVDVMKELPATLILRPFNFNTLAVRAYELASDERLPDASLPSLAIVIAGLIPVILLSLSISQSRARTDV